jgi:hypothetical protein
LSLLDAAAVEELHRRAKALLAPFGAARAAGAGSPAPRTTAAASAASSVSAAAAAAGALEGSRLTDVQLVAMQDTMQRWDSVAQDLPAIVDRLQAMPPVLCCTELLCTRARMVFCFCVAKCRVFPDPEPRFPPQSLRLLHEEAAMFTYVDFPMLASVSACSCIVAWGARPFFISLPPLPPPCFLLLRQASPARHGVGSPGARAPAGCQPCPHRHTSGCRGRQRICGHLQCCCPGCKARR